MNGLREVNKTPKLPDPEVAFFCPQREGDACAKYEPHCASIVEDEEDPCWMCTRFKQDGSVFGSIDKGHKVWLDGKS